jgi:hypothetical protein
VKLSTLLIAAGLLGFWVGYRMGYCWSYVACVLPGVLFMGVAGMPGFIGGALATRALLAGRRRGAIVFAIAGGLAALSAIFFVGPFLRGQDARSSTSALIWVWAPLWAAGVLGLVAFLGTLWARGENPGPPAASWLRAAVAPMLWPVWLVLAVLLVGISGYSFDHSGMVVAEHSSNPNALRRVFQGERAGSTDSGVQLFLAMNHATPADILEVLSQSHFDHVRVQVAGNPNTPTSVRRRLETDPHPEVRQVARIWDGR